MNKKILTTGFILVAIVVVLAAGYVFAVQPILTANSAETPDDSYYAFETGNEWDDVESEDGDNVVEGFDPFAAASAEIPSELPLDLNGLSDDQRTRILNGELTMEELQAELDGASPAIDSNAPGWDEIGSIWDGTSSESGSDPWADFDVDWGSEVLDTSGVNYGTPDVQTGQDTSPADEINGNSSETPVIDNSGSSEGFIPNASSTPVTQATPEKSEVPAPKTADPAQTMPVVASVVLAVAIIGKLLIKRRRQAYE